MGLHPGRQKAVQRPCFVMDVCITFVREKRRHYRYTGYQERDEMEISHFCTRVFAVQMVDLRYIQTVNVTAWSWLLPSTNTLSMKYESFVSKEMTDTRRTRGVPLQPIGHSKLRNVSERNKVSRSSCSSPSPAFGRKAWHPVNMVFQRAIITGVDVETPNAT